ncbi:MAG: c-type cytochrome biogenesis protein CcmI [Thiobacillaceae bacterium]|nr:c-type cytochrome biogenesis protein CcmI [Thiobacillaceae bacterium]
MNPFWTVSLFWIAAVVFVVVAMILVLPGLLRGRTATGKTARREINIAVYRDQLKELETDRGNGMISDDQFHTAKLELEARLADDALTADAAPEPESVSSRKLGYVLAGFLPVAAFGLYFWLGNPAALIEIANGSANAQATADAVPGQHDFMQMIQQVEERTRTNPDDGEAWAMLAKTYTVMERWQEALQAYDKAAKLLPQDASVLSGQAEAVAILNNRVLAGKPMELVTKALELDPNDVKALELSGIHAYQEPETPYAQDILAAQQEAERLVQTGLTGLDNLANPPPVADSQPAAGQAATIAGSVDIAPALKSKLSAKDTVFLFARPGASGAPVAAIRSNAGSLPLEFSLDDSMAMNPGNVLSSHKEVMLVARVSKSGNPIAQPGDMEGKISGVKVGSTGVKLLIDQVVP